MRYIDKPYYDRRFIMIMDDDRGTATSMIDVFRRGDLPQGVHFGNKSIQKNTLYVAHPGERGLYIPLEGHEMAYFNDKIHELQYLLLAQGATEISIKWIKGQNLNNKKNTSSNFSGSASFGFFASGSATYDSENSLKVTKQNNQEIKLEVAGDSGRLPYVPTDLHWLEYEPDWKMMIKQRNAGALSYKLRISSKSQQSLNHKEIESIKVSLEILKAKMEFGYKTTLETLSEIEEETIWEISVKFKPVSSYKLETDNSYSSCNILHSLESYNNPSSSFQPNNLKKNRKQFRSSCESLIKSCNIPENIQIELNRLRMQFDLSVSEADKIINEIKSKYKKNWFARLFGK